MTSRPTPPIGPPPPPEIRRTILLTPRQWIGLPILFLIALFGLLGVFGGHASIQHSAGTTFAVHAEYPDRIHYRDNATFRLTIENHSATVIDTMTISLDPSYMQAFASPKSIPEMHTPYRITLTHVAPHDPQLVTIDVTGNGIGRHHGPLRVISRTDTLTIPLTTTVFP